MTSSSRPPLFTSFEIETNTACNLRCASCPNALTPRKPARMPDELIYGAIAQLQALEYGGAFSPHFYNEPLLDDRIVDIISAARKALPKANIFFFSNFTLMDEAIFYRLYDNVDQFICTIDEPAIKKAINALLPRIDPEKRHKIKTRSLLGGALSNRAGAIAPLEQGMKRPEQCHMVHHYFTVDAFGNAHLCCNDFNSEAIFGNLADSSITAIWESKKYFAARELAAHGAHPLCKKCMWSAL